MWRTSESPCNLHHYYDFSVFVAGVDLPTVLSRVLSRFIMEGQASCVAVPMLMRPLYNLGSNLSHNFEGPILDCIVMDLSNQIPIFQYY